MRERGSSSQLSGREKNEADTLVLAIKVRTLPGRDAGICVSQHTDAPGSSWVGGKVGAAYGEGGQGVLEVEGVLEERRGREVLVLEEEVEGAGVGGVGCLTIRRLVWVFVVVVKGHQ